MQKLVILWEKYFRVRVIVILNRHIYIYSETCLYDHLRIRDNLGIKDNYFSP